MRVEKSICFTCSLSSRIIVPNQFSQYYLIPTISIIYLLFLYYFYMSCSSSRSFLYRYLKTYSIIGQVQYGMEQETFKCPDSCIPNEYVKASLKNWTWE